MVHEFCLFLIENNCFKIILIIYPSLGIFLMAPHCSQDKLQTSNRAYLVLADLANTSSLSACSLATATLNQLSSHIKLLQFHKHDMLCVDSSLLHINIFYNISILFPTTLKSWVRYVPLLCSYNPSSSLVLTVLYCIYLFTCVSTQKMPGVVSSC